jgi:hypothetical protein
MAALKDKQYKLEKTVDELKAIGFHYNMEYQKYVYEFPVFLDNNKKPSITCKIFADEDDNHICWNVCSWDNNSYPPYYNRQYRVTKVVKIIDKNIQKELKKIGAKEINVK